MPIIDIADADDARLDDFRALRDADVRPDRRGVVIAEGVAVVQRLLRSPYPLRAIAGVPERVDAIALPADVVAYRVNKWVLSEVVGFRVTRGVLASADRVAPWSAADLLASSDRVAVLESLNDFENLGALFRNAAAFGVQAVLMDERCADPLYRRSVRVSMGHVLSVPFAVLPGPWPQALQAVRTAGLQLLAMTPRPSAIALRAVPPPRRWAVMLGAEGSGLSDGALAAAHLGVRIPMSAAVDSLNVATAAAVAFAQLGCEPGE